MQSFELIIRHDEMSENAREAGAGLKTWYTG